MIKKFLASKVTSAASTQFVVFGIKMLDTHADLLRLSGICLCVASLAVLFYGWQHSEKPEAVATPARRTRKNRSRR